VSRLAFVFVKKRGRWLEWMKEAKETDGKEGTEIEKKHMRRVKENVKDRERKQRYRNRKKYM
jgi:hypothetical protein